MRVGPVAGVVVLAVRGRACVAQLRLDRRHTGPGESVKDIYEQRFTFSNALSSMRRMVAALVSFRALTEQARKKLPASTVRNVRHTDWETQRLGFANWAGVVEGTLRKQRHWIAKLEYAKARLKGKSGQGLKAREAAYRKAEKEMQKYLDNFDVAD